MWREATCKYKARGLKVFPGMRDSMSVPTIRVYLIWMDCTASGRTVGWMVFQHPFALLMVETAVCGGALRVHGMFADALSDRCHPRAGLVCGSGWKGAEPREPAGGPSLYSVPRREHPLEAGRSPGDPGGR